MIRKCCVAGSFYPSDEKQLFDIIKKYILAGKNTNDIVQGIIAPHAGYIYSGKVAGLTYSEVHIPDTVIIIGPNHTGIGPQISIMNSGSWEIPGHSIEIDADLADNIIKYSSFAKSDNTSHLTEHSIEVQLPFILFKNPSVKLVPIILGSANIEMIENLADAIIESIKIKGSNVLIIASSDMSHYISQKEAEFYDMMALNKIKTLDYSGLLNIVEKENISMCGAAPVAVTLASSKKLGAEYAELIHYNTSGEVSGDNSQVVGYLGAKIL